MMGLEKVAGDSIRVVSRPKFAKQKTTAADFVMNGIIIPVITKKTELYRGLYYPVIKGLY